MKIKKVSIQGFKSFMDRLDIDFTGGISGIVGPNGCGKSNVVDAIRWCMGEQSPKQLRGRQMEDVIFSGTGDFKSLGMAEVSILFENGGGTFPSPFTQNAELSITRRLFRSGESEYRLNNVPCRLKDIQDVFMDTGLGNKAYSIISQGRIGHILEQKPEDTRVMLEEAAGITKYRKKVLASQRKIEATEMNLQRVEDISQEILRQMRSLKRQASKARRYKSISEEIQHLELTLYSNSYQNLKETSRNKSQSTEGLVRQEMALSSTLSRFHAKIENMELDLEDKEKNLAGLRENHLHRQEKVHKKEAEYTSLTKEMEMQEELEKRLNVEKEDIARRNIALRDEKEKLQETLNDMKEKAGRLEEEISLREKRIRPRSELLKKIRKDHEELRIELNSDGNKELGLTHESGYLNKMLGQITDSRSRLENELKNAEAKIETITKASERKSAAREAAVEKLQRLEDMIDQQEAAGEELEQLKENIETELKSVEADLNLTQTRLSSLQSLVENFEGYKMGVRTIMKAKDFEPHQKGHILGLVADMIQVDSKYEQATEAVLADKLQYVVVESQEDGKNAVNYLKNKMRGRSSFIPLRDINGKGNKRPTDHNVPKLQDFVSVPESFKPLLSTLLEGTILVEDLETALSSWKQQKGAFSFVTLDGDLVDRRGVISGGKLAQSSRGLLSRKREMTALKNKINELEKERDELALKLTHAAIEIQQKKDTLENFAEEKWGYQEEMNDFDKILFRFGQELDQFEKLAEKISEDLKRKGFEENRHKKELLEIEEQLQQCKMRREQAERYFESKTLELKESEKEFDQFRDELLKLKADARVAQEEQRSVLREIERLEDYAEDSRGRVQKIEEDISAGHMRRQECLNRKKTLQETLTDLHEELKEAEYEVNQAEQKRQAFQNQIKEEEIKTEEVRSEIEDLKDRINTAKMEYSEIQFKINNIVEVVREKFRLDLHAVHEKYLQEDFSQSETEETLEHKKGIRRNLGEVNLTAIKEHEALKERHDFVQSQRGDLTQSIESLRVAIRKINRTSLDKFIITFHEVDKKLKNIFPILFNGGTAGLKLIDETKPLESGVLVEVKPPGKKLVHMGLLSGGEKALVAMALLFAIYMIRPSPFCLLDEVDAPLDESNIERFNKLLQEIKRASQIIMVTHSRRTMEISDRLYGITMEKAGVSKIVSVDLGGARDLESNDLLRDQSFGVRGGQNRLAKRTPGDQTTIH